MKKFIRNSFFLAILAGIGYLVFKANGKMKELQGKYENCFFFNGKQMNFKDEVFAGGSYAVMFGGLELDFTGATLEENMVTISLYAECAGVSIKVPEDWQVKLEGSTDKSGVSNVKQFDEENTESPVLIIHHELKMSGLEVK